MAESTARDGEIRRVAGLWGIVEGKSLTDNLTDWCPHINWLEPEAERDYARHISMQLHMLQIYENNFRSALSLLDHLEIMRDSALSIENPIDRMTDRASISKWLTIPIESAAFSVYHFQSTLRSVRDQLRYAPTLAKKVDSRGLQKAYDRFQTEFPQWKVIRDFIGHYADKMFSPANIEAMRGDAGPVIHGGSGSGRRLLFTQGGKYIYFDATYENVELLRLVKLDAYQAFAKASVWPYPN